VVNKWNTFAKSQKIPSTHNLTLRALTISLFNSYIAFLIVRFDLNPYSSSNNVFSSVHCPVIYCTQPSPRILETQLVESLVCSWKCNFCNPSYVMFSLQSITSIEKKIRIIKIYDKHDSNMNNSKISYFK